MKRFQKNFCKKKYFESAQVLHVLLHHLIFRLIDMYVWWFSLSVCQFELCDGCCCDFVQNGLCVCRYGRRRTRNSNKTNDIILYLVIRVMRHSCAHVWNMYCTGGIAGEMSFSFVHHFSAWPLNLLSVLAVQSLSSSRPPAHHRCHPILHLPE